MMSLRSQHVCVCASPRLAEVEDKVAAPLLQGLATLAEATGTQVGGAVKHCRGIQCRSAGGQQCRSGSAVKGVYQATAMEGGISI
jgi:hypothetical protein